MSKQRLVNKELQVVKSVQFGIYSEQDILKQSVCEVTSNLIYNQETSLPAKNGLNDPRMGVMIRGLACQTCFGDLKQCPGHFGHIKLAEIVYHPEFLETVYKILKSVCFNCSRLLISSEKLSQILQIKNKAKRLKEISHVSQRKCSFGEDQGCERKQPVYRRRKMDILVRRSDNQDHLDEDSKRIFRASEVYDIFKDIQDETIEILGFDAVYSRPEYMLIKLMLVSPPAVRPSIELSSSARSEDDLTHLYKSILSTNQELKKAKEDGQPRVRVDEIVERLQKYVSYLMNNDEGIAKQKGGRPVKSISQRLKGKEGRLRGNLMGKRVDFSSRTVVSPDPSLELDQLGVPLQIATELTIPVKVTQLNIDFLKKLVERGDEWPGARYYFSKAHNNEMSDLNFIKSKPNLQYGDVVERHLMNNDYVVFNRQPSLHKMSIMGHRVKVLPGSTFRLNLAVTTPYNADFDGDEMNMHVPQNLETTSEVKHIMHVPKQIITPQSNRAVMGLNQDSLLGIRLFTLKDSFVTKEVIFDLLMHLEDWDGVLPQPAIVKPKKLWTGKQILSFIIPKINYIKKLDDAKDFYFDDTSVVIKRGEHLVGSMNKSIVGAKKGSLIGCIWIDYGPEETKKFLTYSQKLIIQWMLYFGWTVGIKDTIIPVSLLKKIDKKRNEAQIEFHQVLQDTQKEKKKLIVHQPGKTIIQSFEIKVNNLLNDCRAEIGKLLKESVGIENHFKSMIISGSKGNNINISQISGLVGQQNINGKRIPFGFHKRTLPHFLKNDFGPESRGFVANSYYKGLIPQEFFFHTMAGREGLIDTAVKTSQTGYIQRRLVKALEDVMVQYDYSVRDSNGNLIQYLYGEDGIAPEFIEEQKFNLLKQSDEQLIKNCLFFKYDEEIEDLGFEDSIQNLFEKKRINLEVRDELLSDKKAHDILFEEFQQITSNRDELRKIFTPGSKIGILPVNVDRLISHSQFQTDQRKVSDLSPLFVVRQLEISMKKLEIVFIEKYNKEMSEFSKKLNDRALFLFRCFLRYKLCSRKVILDYKLSRRAFSFLLDEIENCFIKSKIDPGEMCGSISAQSLGETLTQMTLNTFHFAGVSSQNITLGVPRIQEIINISKTIKGASMKIYLKEPFCYSSEAVHKLISTLEFTTIGHLHKTSDIYFDPKLNETVVEEDQDLLFLEEEHENYSPWVLRITIDPVQLGRKGIQLKEIINKIEKQFPNDLQIIESLETADPIVIRIRQLKRSNFDYNDIQKIEQYILNDMSIKGFCKKVSYRRQKRKNYSQKLTKEEEEGEFILETSGTDIKRVLRIANVDTVRTSTNHIWDIHNNFGIEAARVSIMREIGVVFDFFNIYVNYRHITLLADCICSQGKLMSISRNGINRVYTSPFRKCSFEETVDILIKAAVYANKENLKGVTENIMMGQLCKMGTGAFDILMDTEYLLPTEENKEKVTAQWNYFPDLNPPLEIETGLEDDVMSKYIQTPNPNMNTPLPMNDMNRTPIYNNIINSPGGNYNTPVMTPGGINSGMTPLHNRMQSPHQNTTLYSPFTKRQYQTPNYNKVMSPLLPPQLGQMSPHYQGGNMNSSHIIQNTGNDLKYSPITPNYNASPHKLQSPGARLQSPNSSKHLANMSPTYTYSQSSPMYSPNSNLSSGLQSMPSSSQLKNSPSEGDQIMNSQYKPESPSYMNTLVEKKEVISDDEENNQY